MSEEKSQPKHAATRAWSCCGPEMVQKMEAIFGSTGPREEGNTRSCFDRMAEMMRDCCVPFAGKDEPASEDEMGSRE